MPGAGSEFDLLAGGYDRHRPAYPLALLDALREHLEEVDQCEPRLVVDAGAGTGIATRLLRACLDARYRVLGLEPGEGVRRQAIASTGLDLDIAYIAARAEDMPFETGTLCGIVVAQALQWFDRPRFYREAVRVLAPGGTLAVIQNNRD